jgi:CBS domain-containing protein
VNDPRILTFTDLEGHLVGVVTQADVDDRPAAPRKRAPLGIITYPRQ